MAIKTTMFTVSMSSVQRFPRWKGVHGFVTGGSRKGVAVGYIAICKIPHLCACVPETSCQQVVTSHISTHLCDWAIFAHWEQLVYLIHRTTKQSERSCYVFTAKQNALFLLSGSCYVKNCCMVIVHVYCYARTTANVIIHYNITYFKFAKILFFRFNNSRSTTDFFVIY